MPLLDTEKQVEGAYNGFFFNVRAQEADVTVLALWGFTQSNHEVAVKVYACKGDWNDSKTTPFTWEQVSDNTESLLLRDQ
jgi:hypothetical protein